MRGQRGKEQELKGKERASLAEAADGTKALCRPVVHLNKVIEPGIKDKKKLSER